MKAELKSHFPCWFLDLKEHSTDYTLILSNDYDSLLSCRFLRSTTGIEVGGYYDFSSGLYLTDNIYESSKKQVFIDVSCFQDGFLCVDNHRTLARNHMSINPNKINVASALEVDAYKHKYCGSTLMLLVSLFRDSIGTLSERQKLMLLAVDGFYLGFFKLCGKYAHINRYWLDLLELSDDLMPLINQPNIVKEIERIKNECGLDNVFFLDTDGALREHLPKEPKNVLTSRLVRINDEDEQPRFRRHVLSVRQTHMDTQDLVKMNHLTDRHIFSAAETRKGKYTLSVLEEAKSA